MRQSPKCSLSYRYLWAAAIRILACIAIACVFATFWDRSPALGGGVLTRGISFGALLWAALILPLVLEAALFVQWHRGFVIGLLLDWLVLCVLASLAAAYSVRAQLEDNPARWEVKVLEGGARCRLREESILCIDVSQYLSQVYHVALGAQI